MGLQRREAHMIKLYEGGAYLIGGKKLIEDGPEAADGLEAAEEEQR